MQTERVTFLTSAESKAALDAFAARSGKSVGNVLREAASRYISEDPATEAEEALNLILPELEALLPHWNAKLDAMQASIADARASVREALARVEATR